MVPTFQYISCYCLSSLVIIWFLVPPSFQYISCYCLSGTDGGSRLNFPYFNTSHVTVYPLTIIDLNLLSHFNTSHVTVYRCWTRCSFYRDIFQYISCYCLSTHHLSIHNRNRISIHLMLLFINCYIVNCLLCSIFQYISCYCLSYTLSNRNINHNISIHLMLLFIPFTFPFIRSSIVISIHLMLLFILSWF